LQDESKDETDGMENNNRCFCLQNTSTEEKETMLEGGVVNNIKNVSVFNELIGKSPTSTDVLLNSMIKDNGFEKDSPNYVVIYDLELFHRESLKEDGGVDDMKAHSKILEQKSDILLHPISAMMLILKWNRISPIFWMVGVQYGLFVLSLTATALLQTNILMWFPQTNATYHECGENQTFGEIIKYSDDSLKIGFYSLYVLLVINTIILLFRETTQMIYCWESYIRSMEDVMEAIMMLITTAYVVSIFTCRAGAITTNLSAWSVFLSWVELILFIGRHPRAALYVHMFTSVLKVLLGCLIMYSPALVAFALTFHLLMPTNDVFVDPVSSFLKVFTMMLGELEYVSNFSPNSEYTSVNGHAATGSTQIIFVLFLIAFSIIIVNLLVGLTIGELDILKERARAIRLKRITTETLGVQKIWSNNNVMGKWILSPLARLCGYNFAKLNLFPQAKLKKVEDMKLDKLPLQGVKVCVYPYEQRDFDWLSGRSITGETNQYYNVYVYDEEERFSAVDNMKKLGIIPSSVVVRSQQIIEERKEAHKMEKENQEQITDSRNIMNSKEFSHVECDDILQHQRRKETITRQLEEMENKVNTILASLEKFQLAINSSFNN
jgi:hypothetical protein